MKLTKSRTSVLLTVLVAGCAGFSGATKTLDAAPATAQNLLQNRQFAQVKEGMADGWTKFEGGYQMALQAGRAGQNAVVCERTGKDDKACGISQIVTLNQQTAQPIVFSGWSKAANVAGPVDNDYSLYADIAYQDGTNQWGEAKGFSTGTHDWERIEYRIIPAKPVKSLTFYALLRGTHTGKAWFSDVTLSVANAT